MEDYGSSGLVLFRVKSSACIKQTVRDAEPKERFKWISSGDTFSPIFVDIRDGDETLVHSATMSSSGSGHYYYNYTSVRR